MGYDREEESRVRLMVAKLAIRELNETHEVSRVKSLGRKMDKNAIKRIATYKTPRVCFTKVTPSTVAVRTPDGGFVDPVDGVPVGGWL